MGQSFPELLRSACNKQFHLSPDIFRKCSLIRLIRRIVFFESTSEGCFTKKFCRSGELLNRRCRFSTDDVLNASAKITFFEGL